MTMEIKGRDLVAGVPRTLTASPRMNSRTRSPEPVNGIVEAVKMTLERTSPPPEARRGHRGS